MPEPGAAVEALEASGQGYRSGARTVPESWHQPRFPVSPRVPVPLPLPLPMSDPDPRDLRWTGEEAERLLRELEETDASHPPPGSASERRRSRDRRPARRGRASSCLLTLVSMGAAVVGLLYVAPWMSEFLDGAGVPLSYRSSCGSRSSPGGAWWPVLGPADPEVVATVRRRYCGDAFINASGVLQVASFRSPQEAEAFARRLGREIGVPFRTGRSPGP